MLRPRHLDLTTGRLTVQETIVEVSHKNAPDGQRMIHKPYPKDDEPRTMGLDPALVAELAAWIEERGLGADDLLFTTRDGTPISRNTFRTRVSRPAVLASGVGYNTGSTTYATPTPPGSSPADPTSAPCGPNEQQPDPDHP